MARLPDSSQQVSVFSERLVCAAFRVLGPDLRCSVEYDVTVLAF
jgi:hypothetical protein